MFGSGRCRIRSNNCKRKAELHAAVDAAAKDKKKVLEEQHALIEAEKNKVEQECEGLQHQVWY